MTIEEALAYAAQLESELAAAAEDSTFTLTGCQLRAVIWVSEQRGVQREQEAAVQDVDRKMKEGW